MSIDIEVKMGEIALTRNRDNLIAYGVGSCVIITLYDHLLKIGAMAHAMLPCRRELGGDGDSQNKLQNTKYGQALSSNPAVKNTKYVDDAIDEMLKNLELQNVQKKNLAAKIIGGANMFPTFTSDIGKNNVRSAKSKLKSEGIKIIGESIGGSTGRSVEFSVSSGIVTVRIKF